MVIKRRKLNSQVETVVECISLTNLMYNAYVEQYPNIDALLYKGDEVINVKFCKNYCINPKPMLLNRRKVDRNSYKLYFVSKKPFFGSYSLSVPYDDPTVDGIREIIDLNLTYTYNVDSPELLLNMVDGAKDSYSAFYFTKCINKRIDNCVKKYVLRSLLEKGYVETIQSMYTLSDRIEETINS